jgi:hypothetical protein
MHVALSVSNQIYSWSRSGFSPWRCELNKRLLTAHSDRQSDENTLCEFITPIVEFNFNEKLAMGRECLDGEKIIFDTDKMLTHIGGLSHFLEICETSNADEADHGLEETLELDDQLSCETLYGCNENLQLEEVYGACLGMMPPSAGCVTDQFSPQCLNHQC